MSCDGIDILIGALCLHVLQLLSSLLRADLTIYHSPLLISLGVLGIEGDGLVVVAGSLTTIGTEGSLYIAEQQIGGSILVLGLGTLVGVACELIRTSGIFLLEVCAGDLQQCLGVFLILLISGVS